MINGHFRQRYVATRECCSHLDWVRALVLYFLFLILLYSSATAGITPQPPRDGVSIPTQKHSVRVEPERGRFDSHRCFRYEATALVKAPMDAVFDSLVHKEQLNALSYSLVLLRAIESKDQHTRILEWGAPPGSGQLVPRDPASVDKDFGVYGRERITYSPVDHAVSWEELKVLYYSYFRDDFALEPQDTATLVSFSQVSCAVNSGSTTETQKDEMSRANEDLRGWLDRVIDLIASKAARGAITPP
jgi:hypothetical protein